MIDCRPGVHGAVLLRLNKPRWARESKGKVRFGARGLGRGAGRAENGNPPTLRFRRRQGLAGLVGATRAETGPESRGSALSVPIREIRGQNVRVFRVVRGSRPSLRPLRLCAIISSPLWPSRDSPLCPGGLILHPAFTPGRKEWDSTASGADGSFSGGSPRGHGRPAQAWPGNKKGGPSFYFRPPDSSYPPAPQAVGTW